MEKRSSNVKEESLSTRSAVELYPKHLDPFAEDGDDEESKDQLTDLPSIPYPDELDPFINDDEEDENENNKDVSGSDLDSRPPQSQDVSSNSKNTTITVEDYDDSLDPFYDGTNTLDSEDDVQNSDKAQLRDSKSSERELNNNVGKNVAPIPAPRKSLSNRASSSILPSTRDVSSYSTSSLERKKETSATPDRLSLGQLNSDIRHSMGNLSCISVQSSSGSSPARSRKKRKAPNPPGFNCDNLNGSQLSANASDAISVCSDLGYTPERCSSKNGDDNGNNQSPSVRSTEGESDTSINNMDKNTFGYWRRRKKRQAPSIPIPKRNIVTIPLTEIVSESNLISDKLSNIERRMNMLEKSLAEENQKSKLKRQIVEYLQLAREKCQLCKRQEELVCLKTQHKLQEQQTEIEYQIRILDAKPLSMKTQADESKYEELVTNIVEIVEKRNDVEEEMIQINKREEYVQLIERLKQLRVDENMDSLVNECLKKQSKGKDEKNKKEFGLEHALKSKIGKISTLKRHISNQK